MNFQSWAIFGSRGCREKKNKNCHKYATFEGSFLLIFSRAETIMYFFFKNIVASGLKRYILYLIYLLLFFIIIIFISIIIFFLPKTIPWDTQIKHLLATTVDETHQLNLWLLLFGKEIRWKYIMIIVMNVNFLLNCFVQKRFYSLPWETIAAITIVLHEWGWWWWGYFPIWPKDVTILQMSTTRK